MIDPFAFLRGPIRHMKLIGQAEEHKALRARNEARLAALKAANRLYEDKRERPANHAASAIAIQSIQSIYNNAAAQQQYPGIAGNGYAPGSALSNILGVSGSYFGTDDQW